MARRCWFCFASPKGWVRVAEDLKCMSRALLDAMHNVKHVVRVSRSCGSSSVGSNPGILGVEILNKPKRVGLG